MSAGTVHPIVLVKTVPGQHVRALVSPDLEPPLGEGDPVVVQADGGTVMGRVVRVPGAVEARPGAPDHYRVIRRATHQDTYLRQRHAQRERDALRLAIMKVRERGLAMKLVRVEQMFDGSRLVFYFTAEERVDFRELVRELATEYKTRIELRQIGVRDEAKLLSGYGTCGRPLCCSTFLKAFDPVSIKMAKQQDLALNPARLSGLCGRLKCCLRYELPPTAVNHVRDEAAAGAADDAGGCDAGACDPGGCHGVVCRPGGAGA
ncbi:MAG: regulatory iron-sulfur-containing complex subunit RicT [Vicinamibacterales bacterium]|nr:regulatory iron-sulfur-containing complex subunit RicT [Vicinamibacterales bacterium]